jgi:glycosyltransferase involved in cell wall biosynthesis
MSEVTLLITSFNRPDLLQRTVDSVLKYANYDFADKIIIEDSGDTAMNKHLLLDYPDWHLIIHSQTKGGYESIDQAYQYIETSYVLHIEDDWEFTHGGFMEQAIEVLDHDKTIMQVSLEHNSVMGTLPEVHNANGVEYQIVGEDINGWWHGFTCHPSVRSMEGYEKTKPWVQWSGKEEELFHRELKVGLEYFRLGYKAAILKDSYCIHTGLGRCTWHPNA